MFLFAVGYSVGPQFFRGLKKEGLPQVLFAVVMCLFCLLAPFVLAKIMGYSAGEAAGLLAGSQTISAVLGVAEDTINQLGIPVADKNGYDQCHAGSLCRLLIFSVRLVSAWIMSDIAPRLLGGIESVKKSLSRTGSQNGVRTTKASNPASCLPPVRSRSAPTRLTMAGSAREDRERAGRLFGGTRKTPFRRTGPYRWCDSGCEIRPNAFERKTKSCSADVVKFVIGEEDWIGDEVNDIELLDFPAETLPVLISRKEYAGMTVAKLRKLPVMHGVSIKSIKRAGINIPVLAATTIDPGDMLELVGTKLEVNAAADTLGYADRPTNQTDMIFVGLGIFLGGVVGALAIHLGGVPISLSTSGGALIAGLVFGWLRSKHPTFGRIPEPSLWVLNNVGLNMFIAVVGITAGPSFVTGLKEVGVSLFFIGALATAIPLIVGVLLGRYVFKFHPAITLGCTSGARTTTAALGAVEDAVESQTPALGYTVTYAVGNTLLIIWGVVIVLLMT